MWKFEKFNKTFIYKEDNYETKDNGIKKQKLLHKEIGKIKLKGIRGSFKFNYLIPEFYKKIASGDKQTIIHAFIIFGFFSFTVFTFLAIGIGLVNEGDKGGWYFIGITILIILFLTFSHIRQHRK